MTATKAATVKTRAQRPTVLLLRKVGQVLCRHSWMLVQYRDRMFLRCPSCGAESPGFTVAPAQESPRS